MEYNLVINENQAKILSSALEVFERLGLGQIDVGIEEAHKPKFWRMEGNPLNREVIRYHCDQLKYLITGHQGNSSFGITSPEISDDYRVARDIQQVIDHRMAWDKKPEGGIGINFHEPIQWSKEPLPSIGKV